MHPSSYRLMAAIVKQQLTTLDGRVLDVGGANVNGSYRPIFNGAEYTTLDRENADVIVDGYDWPLEDESFDVVISGQALEHDPRFWLTAQNMARVLKPGGLLVIIVPSRGRVHRFPVDCYRFLPDSMAALADIMQVELIKTHWNRQVEWGDLAGVFKKAGGSP